MGWDSKILKEVFSDITKGPKASKMASALGEISVDSGGKTYERLCPHCYDILEIDKKTAIWGCLNCTRSFVATDNIDEQRRVATALLTLFGVLSKIAIRNGMVAEIESRKISQKILEYCDDEQERIYQAKIDKIAREDSYSLDYFSELLFSSFEGKRYREYREVLYRTLFELISSDGKLYSYEMEILKDIASLMKFENSIYDYLYAEMIGSMSSKEAYSIFSLRGGSSDEEIEKVFIQKLSYYEEESLESLNFPKIFKEFSIRHSESLKRAYAVIKDLKK
jgi:uncharacterized tellurite resistance protein B-like protein